MSDHHDFDLASVRASLSGASGQEYWRSLEELANTDVVQEYLHREFPDQATEFTDPVGRRQFLRLMGASLALAGVSACTKQPAEVIVPYVRAPEEIVPGKPLCYATAVTFGGYATGVLVESHEGRPTKIEGNPEHPASLGATDLFAQAQILALYDPDRSQTLKHRGDIRTCRNTVRAVIQRQGVLPHTTRKDKIQIDPYLLRRLYQECDGWAQRVHEKLVEEERIAVSYPTLTRWLRELGLSQARPERCDHVPDVPGAEMQHDTTIYQVRLSDRPTRVIASLLYLRYSKRRYLRFYRAFNRFALKCFLHEALMYWGYSAPRCIIDNTNLARLRGSGKRAVIVPEMATFAGRYGFQFVRSRGRGDGPDGGRPGRLLPGPFVAATALGAGPVAAIRVPFAPQGRVELLGQAAFFYPRIDVVPGQDGFARQWLEIVPVVQAGRGEGVPPGPDVEHCRPSRRTGRPGARRR